MANRSAKETRPATEDAERYSAPALEKGLDVLELLSTEREPLTMGQIAERLKRSKGELFRMLVALERRDYIRHDGDRDRFTISTRLFELAMRTAPTRDLVSVVLPHLEVVAQELDQSCYLAVLSGLQIAVIARVEAPGELGFAVRIGYRRRLDHSTSGRVMVAYLQPGARERLFAALAAEYADFDPGALAGELDRVVARGFEAGPSSAVKGIIDIGAPVFGPGGTPIASITSPFIRRASSSMTTANAGEIIRREADRASQELGVQSRNPMVRHRP